MQSNEGKRQEEIEEGHAEMMGASTATHSVCCLYVSQAKLGQSKSDLPFFSQPLQPFSDHLPFKHSKKSPAMFVKSRNDHLFPFMNH